MITLTRCSSTPRAEILVKPEGSTRRTRPRERRLAAPAARAHRWPGRMRTASVERRSATISSLGESPTSRSGSPAAPPPRSRGAAQHDAVDGRADLDAGLPAASGPLATRLRPRGCGACGVRRTRTAAAAGAACGRPRSVWPARVARCGEAPLRQLAGAPQRRARPGRSSAAARSPSALARPKAASAARARAAARPGSGRRAAPGATG